MSKQEEADKKIKLKTFKEELISSYSKLELLEELIKSIKGDE